MTLQNRTLVTDNEGNTTEAFADLAEVYASRRDTLGSERIASGAEVAVADAVIPDPLARRYRHDHPCS